VSYESLKSLFEKHHFKDLIVYVRSSYVDEHIVLTNNYHRWILNGLFITLISQISLEIGLLRFLIPKMICSKVCRYRVCHNLYTLLQKNNSCIWISRIQKKTCFNGWTKLSKLCVQIVSEKTSLRWVMRRCKRMANNPYSKLSSRRPNCEWLYRIGISLFYWEYNWSNNICRANFSTKNIGCERNLAVVHSVTSTKVQ
jgi:hypothetical protein